jgi:SHS family sialic acid transporter-like MFS transporter
VTKPPIAVEFSAKARYLILAAAFLGWAASGFQMAVMTLTSRAATTDFLRRGQLSADKPFAAWRILLPEPEAASPGRTLDEAQALKQTAPLWLSWYNATFLLGAAAGGLGFGWLGDRIGRVKAMAASILCFSAFSGLGYFAATPEQLLLLRVFSGMGVGGMWPTGVSLASEAWADASRPLISGMLGTSANVGLLLFNLLGFLWPVGPESWRWTLLVCASPLVLGVVVWWVVPESRRWLAACQTAQREKQKPITMATVFQPPLLSLTLIGIAVGTIPLLGGWAATQWVIPWADSLNVWGQQGKAMAGMMRSGGAVIGGLLGGWLASLVGRRLTYFLISLTSLGLGEAIYLLLSPNDGIVFWTMVFLLGVVSTLFFGWLPLYLPELFPTQARATGAGVSFNFGRILTAVGVLGAGSLTAFFNDDYGRAGSVTTLVYALGLVVILFAPDTTKRGLRESASG